MIKSMLEAEAFVASLFNSLLFTNLISLAANYKSLYLRSWTFSKIYFIYLLILLVIYDLYSFVNINHIGLNHRILNQERVQIKIVKEIAMREVFRVKNDGPARSF